jgi:hypothetical protein
MVQVVGVCLSLQCHHSPNVDYVESVTARYGTGTMAMFYLWCALVELSANSTTRRDVKISIEGRMGT